MNTSRRPVLPAGAWRRCCEQHWRPPSFQSGGPARASLNITKAKASHLARLQCFSLRPRSLHGLTRHEGLVGRIHASRGLIFVEYAARRRSNYPARGHMHRNTSRGTVPEHQRYGQRNEQTWCPLSATHSPEVSCGGHQRYVHVWTLRPLST